MVEWGVEGDKKFKQQDSLLGSFGTGRQDILITELTRLGEHCNTDRFGELLEAIVERYSCNPISGLAYIRDVTEAVTKNAGAEYVFRVGTLALNYFERLEPNMVRFPAKIHEKELDEFSQRRGSLADVIAARMIVSSSDESSYQFYRCADSVPELIVRLTSADHAVRCENTRQMSVVNWLNNKMDIEAPHSVEINTKQMLREIRTDNMWGKEENASLTTGYHFLHPRHEGIPQCVIACLPIGCTIPRLEIAIPEALAHEDIERAFKYPESIQSFLDNPKARATLEIAAYGYAYQVIAGTVISRLIEQVTENIKGYNATSGALEEACCSLQEYKDRTDSMPPPSILKSSISKLKALVGVGRAVEDPQELRLKEQVHEMLIPARNSLINLLGSYQLLLSFVDSIDMEQGDEVKRYRDNFINGVKACYQSAQLSVKNHCKAEEIRGVLEVVSKVDRDDLTSAVKLPKGLKFSEMHPQLVAALSRIEMASQQTRRFREMRAG